MRRFAALFCITFLLSGCGGSSSGGNNTTPPIVAAPPSGNNGTQSFNPASVHISEVSVPTSSFGAITPNSLDVGSDGSVYFGKPQCCGEAGPGIYRYVNGAFTTTQPFPQANVVNGGVDAVNAHGPSTVVWASTSTASGSTQSQDLLECGAAGGTAVLCNPSTAGFAAKIVSIAITQSGTIWAGGIGCCGTGAAGSPAQIPGAGSSQAPCGFLVLSNGPNNHVWGTLAQFCSSGAVPVYEFADDGTILHTYSLPSGSEIGPFNVPGGIPAFDVLTLGTDGALWFTDSGHNAIARMSGTGQLTEYPVPTPNSGVDGITTASDGGMWFTESAANKIGRIDTTGKIFEFTVPTANSAPEAIAAPPSGASCNPFQVWFGEVNGNKLGEITY
jgi:streptogramin lyase